MAREVREHIEDVRAGDATGAKKTGIRPVDEVLEGGIHDGRYYMIAARPKMGKTKLAVAISTALITRHGYAVDFWYTDGPKRHITAEYISILTGVPASKILDSPDALTVESTSQVQPATGPNGEKIYSNDGKTWFTPDGKKVQ